MKANYDVLVTWKHRKEVTRKKITCNLKRIRKQLLNKNRSSFIKQIKVELHK